MHSPWPISEELSAMLVCMIYTGLLRLAAWTIECGMRSRVERG